MKITPKFYQPLWKQTVVTLYEEVWPEVMKAWDEKNYKQSISNLLDYVNPNIKTLYKSSQSHTYQIPHGSSIIEIMIKENDLTIIGKLVCIEKANKAEIIKEVAEINYRLLKRSQIRITEHDLIIYYASSLVNCEPTKIYSVLKEICYVADHYDDLLIKKYNATHLAEPKVIKLKSTDKILARSIALAILDETIYYVQYLETLNLTNEIVDLLEIALYRIDLALSPQGLLKSKLEQTLNFISEKNNSKEEKIEIGKNFIQFIKQMPIPEFDEHLYQAEVFITQREIVSTEYVYQMLIQLNDRCQKLIQNNHNYPSVCIQYLHELYKILYQYNLKPTLHTNILRMIREAAETKWEEAASFLFLQISQEIKNHTTVSYVINGNEKDYSNLHS